MPKLASPTMVRPYQTVAEAQGAVRPQFRNPFSSDKTPINVAQEHAAHQEDRMIRDMARLDPFAKASRGAGR